MPDPEIFIVGAMKSGTTTLHRMLNIHPDIFMCDPKEPSYFAGRKNLEIIWPEILTNEFSRNLDAYLSLFATAGNSQKCGESSSAYTKYPLVKGVPTRIFEFNPTAKIIYVMRDPIERIISHYWHMVRNHGEKNSIEEVIFTDPQYLAFGDYVMQLEQYFAVFPRHQVYTLTLEELRKTPVATINNIFNWLGVDTLSAPVLAAKKAHETPKEIRLSRNIRVLNQLRKSRLWEAISPIAPIWLRQFGRSLSHRTIDRAETPMTQLMKMMDPVKTRQIEKLSELLGRNFPEWSVHE